MNLFLDLWTIVGVLAGAFFFFAGTVGLLRFPDSLTRLHALSKADNLGLGLVVLGLLPLVGSVAAGIKLIGIWLLVLLSGATAAQWIGSQLSCQPSRRSSSPRQTPRRRRQSESPGRVRSRHRASAGHAVR